RIVPACLVVTGIRELPGLGDKLFQRGDYVGPRTHKAWTQDAQKDVVRARTRGLAQQVLLRDPGQIRLGRLQRVPRLDQASRVVQQRSTRLDVRGEVSGLHPTRSR